MQNTCRTAVGQARPSMFLANAGEEHVDGRHQAGPDEVA